MHITNGSSAAEVVKKAFELTKNDILPVNDLLSFGPLGGFTTIEEWVGLREGYWGNIWKLCGLAPMGMSEFRRDFYFSYPELDNANRIDIWVGTSLGDQITLSFLVMFFDNINLDFSKVYVHQLSICRKENFKLPNPGLVKSENLPNSGDVFQLSYNQKELLKKSWSVVSSNSPDNYLDFIAKDQSELPFLIPALRTLVNRYPDKQTGLSVWQKHILEITYTYQPNTARIVGGVLGESIDGLDLIGDTSVLAEIKKMGLSSNKHQLVKLNEDFLGLRETKVEITELGLAVLKGQENLIDLIGVDDWIGGVHLTDENRFYEVRENFSV